MKFRPDNATDTAYDNTASELTATDVQDALDEVDSTLDTHAAASVAHGTTGEVVGTTDEQTLTGKTIDANSNTLTHLEHGAEVDNPSSGVHGVEGDIVGTTDPQTLENKTMVSPVIADQSNSQHDHSNAAGGGRLSHLNLTEKGENTHAQIDSHIAAASAHGRSSPLVGETDVQTLTNKTLTSPKINEDVALTATATELNRVRGVTSGVQEQLDTKAADADLTTHEGATSVHGISGDVVGTTDLQTLEGKALIAPTIADLSNAQHNHASAAGGGLISHADLTDKGTNTHPQIDTHITASAAHGVSGELVGTTDTQTLEHKTMISPIIADQSNSQHDHSNAAGGGSINPTDIPYSGAVSGLSSTDVKAAIDEIDGDLDTHIADTTAHIAGHISYSPGVSGLAATTAQGAIDEVDSDLDSHKASSSAHGADDITFSPSGTGLTATTVQAALAELARDVIVGFRIDTLSSSPSLTWVDINKNVITGLNTAFFDAHSIWGRIRTCVIDPDTGNITYGSNARGDGLDLTGASGDVMVEYNEMYWAAEYDGSRYEYHWLSPYEYAGLPIHPWFSQRGGNVTKMYLGAYGASFALDGTTGKLYSATGKTPVTGEVSYTDLPNGGRFTIADSELFGNNKGTGWGSRCWWSWHALMLLMYAEFGTQDIQTALGRGVVDLASGTGYAGKANGADNLDTNIGTNGTGTGTGTDGQTPVAYRGLRDSYGGFWEYLTGWLATDSAYQIVNRQGLASAVMPAGSFSDASEYEVSTVAPITADGYIRDYARDNVLTGLFIPATTTGSSSTYACDYWWAHDAGETNILLGGGYWPAADYAGPGYLTAANVSSTSGRTIGARLEFKPQID